MAKEIKDFRKATGEETYWTDSAFGGMPTYQLGAKYPNNYIKKLDLAIRILPRPADYLLLYFLGFYLLMLSLRLNWKYAALGALAFGFSTYLIVILGVGHNAKAHAIAYMPLVLTGVVLVFRKCYWLGFAITAIGMGLEIVANHLQMTYYLMLLILVLGVVYGINAIRKQWLPHFLKSVVILFAAVLLAIGMNATNLMATSEYTAFSTRGKSEITIYLLLVFLEDLMMNLLKKIVKLLGFCDQYKFRLHKWKMFMGNLDCTIGVHNRVFQDLHT